MATSVNPDIHEMDRNPMMQSLYNPIMQMGVVPGKAFPDHLLIDERMANADDPAVAVNCYNGGGQERNHDILMGDCVFGQKGVRSPEMMLGHPNEVVTATVAGLYIPDFGCQHTAERQVYFVGVSQTDYRYSGNPSGSSLQADPEHGIATVKTGTCSVINNGPFVQYAGGYVMYRYPPSTWSPYDMVEGDNKFGDQINRRVRAGDQPTRLRPELVPYDYADFTTEIDGAHYLMMTPCGTNRVHGISDLTLSEFLSRKGITDSTNFSAEQEVAGGHKFGTVGAVLAGCLEKLIQSGMISVNHLDANHKPAVGAFAPKNLGAPSDVHIAKAAAIIQMCGFWDKEFKDDQLSHQMFENVFFRDLVRTDIVEKIETALTKNYPGVNSNVARTVDGVANNFSFSNDSDANYQKIRFYASRLAMGAVSGNMFFKTSKIIGRSLNFAAPSDTMHLLLGHFCL